MMRRTILLALAALLSLAPSQTSSTNSSAPPSNLCANPTGFVNHQIRAALPNQPTLQLKLPFLLEHILFFTTVTNIALPEADIAKFCLDQCIGYKANASAGDIPEGNLPPTFVTNKPGPCLSFTVDQGRPFPPNPEDTALRWYCEGFDVRLKEDLSDYEAVNGTVESYQYAIAVNRDCEGEYRAF